VVALAILTLTALAAGIALAVHTFDDHLGPPRSFAMAAFAASAPVERAAVSGHFLGLSLIGLVLVYDGLRKRRALPFVAGALLLALKPHIVLILPLLLVGQMIQMRAWRLLAIGTAAILALALVGFAADPRALPAIAGGTVAKLGCCIGENKSLLVQHTAGGALGATLLLFVAAVATWVAVRAAQPQRRAASVVTAGAALSLVAAPYLHSYDGVLLIPAVLLAAQVAGRVAGLAIVCGFVVASWGSYVLELAGSSIAYSGILPVATLLALAVAQSSGGTRRTITTRAAGT